MKPSKFEILRLTTVPMDPVEHPPSTQHRLDDLGPGALQDAELLSVLFGHGGDATQALATSGGLRQLCKEELHSLRHHPGITTRGANTLACAVELGRRLGKSTDRHPRIRTPRDIYEYLAPTLGGLCKEQFRVLCLDSRNRLVRDVRIAEGTRDSCHVDPRDLFAAALSSRAASAIAIAHSHPSGSIDPSAEDLQLTRQVSDGARLLGLRLVDHVIVGDGYLSFAERGLLESALKRSA